MIRTRVAVLTAAREVLVDEGWEGVTVARVAERSGYARTTLYRHWPQRLDLLRDLIREEAAVAHSVPGGELRADLVAEVEAFRSAMTAAGLGRAMIAIGQHAREDPEVAELNSALRVEGSRVLDEIIEHGITRGLLRPDAGAGAAVSMLVGPVLFRYLFEPEGLTASFVEGVVDRFIEAFAIDVEGEQ
ncbi:MAG: TetR/AcrR family transcriptional regulator [Microthrixaceae bacterium]